MPKRNRAAERKRAERRPRIVPGWTVEPVGVIVQTEQTWAEYDEQRRPEDALYAPESIPATRRHPRDGERP